MKFKSYIVSLTKTNWLYISILSLLGFFTVYNFIYFSQSDFICDDLFLLKAAIYKPFPFFSDWISSDLQFYRPVVILSFYLNYILGGYSPFGYYIFNLLVHIFSCFALYKLLIIFFADSENSEQIKLVAYIFASIFYVLPQNFVNVYWVSGRTDLLMSLFLFISLIFAFKYYSNGKIIYLFLYSALLLLSAASKESWVVVIFYWAVFFVFRNGISKAKRRETINIFIFSILVFLIYFSIRYFIFNNLSGNAHLDFTFERILKFLAYSVFSLTMPLDILEYYYFYKDNYLLFILITLCIACMVFYFVFLIHKKSFDKRFFIILLFILGTFLIYIKNFPTMRLMYSIIPLTAIPVILIKDQFFLFKKTSIYLFILPFLVSLTTGVFVNIFKFDKIQTYNESYYNILPGNNNTFEKIVDLSPLLNIGQSFSLPESNIMINLKVNGFISVNNNNLFIKPLLYQSYAFLNPLSSLNYKVSDKKQIIINSNTDYNVIMAVQEVDVNYRYDKSYFKLQNGIELIPQVYSKDRTGYLTSLKIIIPDYLINSNTGVIYQENGELKITNILDFFKSFE